MHTFGDPASLSLQRQKVKRREKGEFGILRAIYLSWLFELPSACVERPQCAYVLPDSVHAFSSIR